MKDVHQANGFEAVDSGRMNKLWVDTISKLHERWAVDKDEKSAKDKYIAAIMQASCFLPISFLQHFTFVMSLTHRH